MKDKIIELLHGLENEDALAIISEVLAEEFDLQFASKIVLNGYEPCITKDSLNECLYSEGNEEKGCIELSPILKLAEEILNLDDEYGDVEFEYFVRFENEEEAKEAEHDNDCMWLVKNNDVEIKDLKLQFDMG